MIVSQIAMVPGKDVRKRNNHNEIERRRRSRINSSMKNLAAIVPSKPGQIPPAGGGAQNLCKGILLERAVEYIQELQAQNQSEASKTTESDASLYKEIIELRIMNEELKRQLSKATDNHSLPTCRVCNSHLLCLKCTGILSQSFPVPNFSPTNDLDDSQSSFAMKTLPIVASNNISPSALISTSSLGAVLFPPPNRLLATTSPTMVHIDESTISFSNGLGSGIDLNCSLPECTLSDASNEVEMINRNASVPDIGNS